jgi:hypothetical protein
MNRYFFMASAVALSACASISNNEETSFRRLPMDDHKEVVIESQFTAEVPSSISLNAFERRAMEKLKDFSDYLGIISDQSYDVEFRQKAVVQARSMFIDHSKIRFERYGAQKIDIFLSNLQENAEKSKIIISNIALGEPLKETVAALYEGSLIFDFYMISNDGTPMADKHSMKAEFFLIKTSKLFGTTQKVVWEIFLGNIL